MTSHEDVAGEGFKMVDHEEAGTEPEQKDEQEKAGSKSPGEGMKGEGFEVVDQPEPGSSTEEAAPPAGEPEGEVSGIDVYSVLRLAIAQLAGVAWQMMGLQADPFTNAIRKDTAQARVAIDAAAALVEQLKPHVQGQEARDYQSLLTDLRMNFLTHVDTEQKGSG